MGMQYLPGAVGRTRVLDDVLQLAIVLARDAAQRPADELRLVEARADDGKLRCHAAILCRPARNWRANRRRILDPLRHQADGLADGTDRLQRWRIAVPREHFAVGI